MRRTNEILKIAAGAVVTGLLILVPTTVSADPTYCLPGTTNASGLSVDNVTFNYNPADDCYGVVSGNIPSAADLSNYVSDWGGDWNVRVKDDGAAGTVSYLGVNWTLDAPQNTNQGYWTLTIADPYPASLPVVVDIVAVLKGSTSWAAYLFSAQVFSLAGATGGEFKIAFLNNGGQIPGLSSMSLYLRQAATTVEDGEPTVLLMLALGLAGIASAKAFEKLPRRAARV